MSPRTAAPVLAALVLVACQRQSEPTAPKKEDPFAVVAAIDTRASSYKDPRPPTTSPPPGMNPRSPLPAINPADVKISGRTRVEAAGRLFFRVPVEWTAAPPSPDGRPGFIVPGPGGEARVEIFRMAGTGQAAEAKIREWREQFRTAAGAPLAASSGQVQEMVRGLLRISLVDMAGVHAAPGTPQSPQRRDDPETRLLAAIVEYEGESYVFEALGPALTMAIWEHAFADFAASFATEYQP